MEISRAHAQLIHEEMKVACEAVAAKHGYDIVKANFVYGGTAQFKFELGTRDSETGANEDDVNRFRANAKLFGVDPNMVLKVVQTSGGQKFRVMGMRGGKARKNLFKIQSMGGTNYVCGENMLKTAKIVG